MLILYPAALLYSLLSSCNFLVESLEFSMQRTMSSTNSESFTSFPVWISFISFFCSDCCGQTSKTVLSSSGESGHPSLFPDFRGNAFSFSPLRIICCGFIIYGFYYVEVCSFYDCFLESFYHKWVLNFVKGFLCIY